MECQNPGDPNVGEYDDVDSGGNEKEEIYVNSTGGSHAAEPPPLSDSPEDYDDGGWCGEGGEGGEHIPMIILHRQPGQDPDYVSRESCSGGYQPLTSSNRSPYGSCDGEGGARRPHPPGFLSLELLSGVEINGHKWHDGTSPGDCSWNDPWWLKKCPSPPPSRPQSKPASSTGGNKDKFSGPNNKNPRGPEGYPGSTDRNPHGGSGSGASGVGHSGGAGFGPAHIPGYPEARPRQAVPGGNHPHGASGSVASGGSETGRRGGPGPKQTRPRGPDSSGSRPSVDGVPRPQNYPKDLGARPKQKWPGGNNPHGAPGGQLGPRPTAGNPGARPRQHGPGIGPRPGPGPVDKDGMQHKIIFVESSGGSVPPKKPLRGPDCVNRGPKRDGGSDVYHPQEVAMTPPPGPRSIWYPGWEPRPNCTPCSTPPWEKRRIDKPNPPPLPPIPVYVEISSEDGEGQHGPPKPPPRPDPLGSAEALHRDLVSLTRKVDSVQAAYHTMEQAFTRHRCQQEKWDKRLSIITIVLIVLGIILILVLFVL
ncbi:A10 [Alcelaphine gammaherpesvirus 2]|uniref:A10 n=1 Tax=Alcelaphine gammaherpesvirus 2 TaxID=138184 RepID=A0A068AAN0_9GAMA|nr:A10 [Alcelaphine gammaherpesvirus 2]AIA62111.1 A10 [Alcelaphine gammaherpesvirus 2]